MRVGVIGAGITGLSAAHYLSGYAGVSTTVLERAAVPGGRANVDDGAEHCPRVFLNDYSYLFKILSGIPTPGGGSLFDTLMPLRRMVRVGTGWMEVSHLYRILAREIPWRERIRQAMSGRRTRLVAELGYGPNTNRYGSLRNYSLRSLARLSANLLRSKTGLTLDGPTDQSLILPWARHLESRGVSVRTNAAVQRLEPAERGVRLIVEGNAEFFDAVVVTAFMPDAERLLDASGLAHTLVRGQHVHCKALTITLDPHERVLEATTPAIFCHAGINLVLQPRHHRCIVLCTWAASTDVDFIIKHVREFLGLRHPIVKVKVRENQLAEEGVFAADYVAPGKILQVRHPDVYFAGSYVDNSYPLDSGEGAARTAFNAVARMRVAYGLRPLAVTTGAATR